jgi:hypothetical protein
VCKRNTCLAGIGDGLGQGLDELSKEGFK